MPYVVTAQRDGYELRHYAPAVLAQVTVIGDSEQAANMGFGPLVRYISGDNQSNTKLAMTSPVLQQSSTPTEHVVSFVLPADVDVTQIPVPRNSIVTTVVTDARDMAARTYIGRWTEKKFRDNAAELVTAVTRDGLAITGVPAWARYDPPWTPPFMRRNEVLVEIRAM